MRRVKDWRTQRSTAPAAVVAIAVLAAGLALPGVAQPASASAQPSPQQLSNDEAQAMVKRVLQTELAAATDNSHPMQYRLRKMSPRVATTKMIVETRDGDVAHLIAINDGPLSAQDQQNEDARLQGLLADPAQQRHRMEREQGDSQRARKIIRALPDAFLYAYAGIVDTPQGPSYRMTFQPNPNFDPQDLEAQVLKGMAGELWIDAAQQRVTRLQCKRIKDVDYGFGILGKLDQGGTLLLEQADIGNHQWRTTHMVLVMDARFLIKTVKLDTTLDLSQFSPVAAGLSYQQAIQLLESQSKASSSAQASIRHSGR
jgi:hypothetical protein